MRCLGLPTLKSQAFDASNNQGQKSCSELHDRIRPQLIDRTTAKLFDRPGRVVRLLAACILTCSCSDHSPAGTSRCSDETVIAKIKEIEGLNDPMTKVVLDAYAKMGAGMRLDGTVDAIRTVSSSPNEILCEARLTIKVIPTKKTQPSGTAETGDADAQALADSILNTTTSEITYRVQVTDDGQDYVTIIPPETDRR